MLPSLVLLFSLLAAHGAAPANDVCSGALIIPGSGPFPTLTPVMDITEATAVNDPPVPDFYVGKLERSVWFIFKPSANGVYTISTCSASSGTTVPDTVMGLYTSAGGCSGPFVQAAFEDDVCNLQTEIVTALLADTTYYVTVWKFPGTGGEDGLNDLQLRVDGSVAPLNDLCYNAFPISYGLPVFGTTIGATDNYQLATTNGFGGLGQTPSTAPGRDVVYTFTAPSTDAYSFRLWNFDVTKNLLLYVSSSCPPGAGPTPVQNVLGAANRSRVNSAEEVLCLPLVGGQEVRVYVDHGSADDSGSAFILDVTRCVIEQEPNFAITNASRLTCGIEGAIEIPGDLDMFTLGSYPLGWRAFVLVDGEAAKNSDVDLRIVAGTNTVEFDDSNNDTVFGGSSPNIAGAILPGGPAHLLVNYNGGMDSEPYRIFAVVQPPMEDAQAELEPNDTLLDAGVAEQNYFRGTLGGEAPSSDVDIYSFTVSEGDLVFISLDADPLRDNTPMNARLELLNPSGDVLLTANDGAFNSSTNPSLGTIIGFTPFSPGEGLVYRFADEGTFYARVTISPDAAGATGSGDYLLSISRNCRSGPGFGNLAPSLTGLSANPPLIEGTPVRLTGTVLEPDIGDELKVVVFWGDGTSNLVSQAIPGSIDLDLPHTYPPDTSPNTPSVSYLIEVVATDGSGDVGRGIVNATVQNAVPSALTLVPPSTGAIAGQTFTLGGSFLDSGTGDAHTVVVQWGDGTPAQTLNLTAGTLNFSVDHIYAVGAVDRMIGVSVRDDDEAGVAAASINIRVRLQPAAAKFVEIRPAAGPLIRLRIEGTPDATYRIEKADVLGVPAAWTELGVSTVPSTGVFEIDDANPVSTTRFYRAVLVN